MRGGGGGGTQDPKIELKLDGRIVLVGFLSSDLRILPCFSMSFWVHGGRGFP